MFTIQFSPFLTETSTTFQSSWFMWWSWCSGRKE